MPYKVFGNGTQSWLSCQQMYLLGKFSFKFILPIGINICILDIRQKTLPVPIGTREQ